MLARATLGGRAALFPGVHVGDLLTPRTNALFHILQMLQSSARQTGVFTPRAGAADFIRISAIARPPVPERRAAAIENGKWQMANRTCPGGEEIWAHREDSAASRFTFRPSFVTILRRVDVSRLRARIIPCQNDHSFPWRSRLPAQTVAAGP